MRWIALFLLLAAPPAWAQSEDSGKAVGVLNGGTALYDAVTHKFLDVGGAGATIIVVGPTAGATSALDLTSDTIQLQITDLKGTSQSVDSGLFAASRVEFSDGTAGAPITIDGPTMKISRTESLISTNCQGNPNATACNVPLGLYSIGSATTAIVTSGFDVGAQNSSTVSGANVQGANIHGRITGSGVNIAEGAYIEGKRSTPTAKAQGAEITAWNDTTVDCAISYSSVAECDGIWVSSRAKQPTNLDSIAVHIGLGDVNSAWKEGITINNGSVVNNSYNDTSSATNSILISGTHTHAFYADSTGSGDIVLGGGASGGGGALLTVNNGGAVIGGSIYDAGGITIAGGNAPTLSNGVGYALTTTTNGLNLGGQGSANDFTVKNKNGTAVFFIGTGSLQTFFQGAVSAPNHISTGTTFTIASGCGTPGSLTGGASTGSFTAGQIACAPVINLPTAPHGWWCSANDITTTADTMKQTATSASSCTLSGTVVASDVIVFHAEGY